MSEDRITEAVRRRYARLARANVPCDDGCEQKGGREPQDGFGASRYAAGEREAVPAGAIGASLGCGNPTAIADLAAGEVVLDLGSGGGTDVILSGRRVGPTGKAYGLDMTSEMLELARNHAAEAGVTNVEFLEGRIEDVPLPDEAIDVVISNCVINLSTDKAAAIAEAARVLRPGGRFAVSDVIADSVMPDPVEADLDEWTGCIAGALTRNEYSRLLEQAGLVDVSIEETHRVHERAVSAIIRAHKPLRPM